MVDAEEHFPGTQSTEAVPNTAMPPKPLSGKRCAPVAALGTWVGPRARPLRLPSACSHVPLTLCVVFNAAEKAVAVDLAGGRGFGGFQVRATMVAV